MNTFGRLPNDVLKTIDNFCQKPIMDVTVENDNMYLVIKYPYTTQKINLKRSFYTLLSGDKYCNSEKLWELHDFIENLKADKKCRYGRSQVGAYHILEITYDGDSITIQTKNSFDVDLVLDKACIGIFIDVMQKHYDLINDNKQY